MKIILTLLVLILGSTIGVITNLMTVIASGNLAGLQMNPSDTDFVLSQAGQAALNAVNGGIGIVGILLLIAIWATELKKFIKELFTMSLILFVIAPHDGHAFYESSDRAEAYTIRSNQSAFYIPDVGNNLASQVKLNSEEYYNAFKISMKRFAIPHHKFVNSGGWGGFDKYVPDGRLILVDRTTFSREWVSAIHKGTSNKDESIPCQSKEGLNISVGISVGASVTEENAAKFLYHFGTKPIAGDPTSGEIIFAWNLLFTRCFRCYG